MNETSMVAVIAFVLLAIVWSLLSYRTIHRLLVANDRMADRLAARSSEELALLRSADVARDGERSVSVLDPRRLEGGPTLYTARGDMPGAEEG